MKLYYAQGACSLAPHIALIESGLKFDAVRVDLRSKKYDGGDYNSVNPKGSVPALNLDNGQLLTEGAVILQYIADQANGKDLAPKPGTMERYRLQEWLNYIASDVHKTFSNLFGADRMISNSEGNQQLKAATKENLARRFHYLNTHLEKNPYLMGQEFSVADAYLYTVLRWTKPFHIDMSSWPALVKFMERMSARPAVMKAIEAETPPKA